MNIYERLRANGKGYIVDNLIAKVKKQNEERIIAQEKRFAENKKRREYRKNNPIEVVPSFSKYSKEDLATVRAFKRAQGITDINIPYSDILGY